ncbi:MAG: hypothetical protein ABI042_10175 [Verrucomicrobiota bacterium]
MKNKTWIVVKVERGFPTTLRVCKDEAQASKLERREAKKLNPDYDSLGIFCVDLQKTEVAQLAVDC